MTVLFLGSTGLALADTTAPTTSAPAKVSHKTKHVKKVKKGKPTAPPASTTPTK